MAKTRQGIDRIKVRSLRGNIARLEENLRKHKTVCAGCSLYDNSARHACNAGWQMLKDISRAANLLNSYLGTAGDGKADGQGVLF